MRVPCVGAVILDADGRLLLVRRRRAPAAGRWSIPGGRVEPNESLAAAVEREVIEETGLRVRAQEIVGRVDIPSGSGDIYAVTDFRASLLEPADPIAGDDAAEVAWVDRTELGQLECSPGLAETLENWRVWETD